MRPAQQAALGLRHHALQLSGVAVVVVLRVIAIAERSDARNLLLLANVPAVTGWVSGGACGQVRAVEALQTGCYGQAAARVPISASDLASMGPSWGYPALEQGAQRQECSSSNPLRLLAPALLTS